MLYAIALNGSMFYVTHKHLSVLSRMDIEKIAHAFQPTYPENNQMIIDEFIKKVYSELNIQLKQKKIQDVFRIPYVNVKIHSDW